MVIWSSCRAEVAGRITRVGVYENGTPVLDLTIDDLNEVMHYAFDGQDPHRTAPPEWPEPPLTRIEAPPGPYKFVDVQWKQEDGWPNSVTLNMPEGGCYRCCYWFQLQWPEPKDSSQ